MTEPRSAKLPVARSSSNASDADLARRTLRTVAVLLAACVLFVGLLSVTAVLVTGRAVGGATAAGATAPDTTPGAKKPLSI